MPYKIWRCLQDDVPADVKSKRLGEVIAAFRQIQAAGNQDEIGRVHLVGWVSAAPCTLQGFVDLSRVHMAAWQSIFSKVLARP